MGMLYFTSVRSAFSSCRQLYERDM